MRDEKVAFKPMRLCAFSSDEVARLMSRDSWSRESAMVPTKFFEGPKFTSTIPRTSVALARKCYYVCANTIKEGEKR